MTRRNRLFALASLFLLSFSLWAGFQRVMVADVLVVSGLVQVSDLLQLQMTISPPISQPGDTLTLNVVLTNLEQTAVSPELVFQLPTGVTLDAYALPSGMTANVQANSLNWLPVVAANGGQQQFSLPLRVQTADINQPQQELTAVLKLNGAEETLTNSFWVGIPPQIEAIISPPQISVGQPFQLRANMNGSGPVTQAWDLGDGRTLKVNDPLIVFPLAGVYQVRLDASNPLATASQTKTITVVPHPAAQFTLDDLTPGAGQVVTFLSQSGGMGPLYYFWEFGDGSSSQEANPQHTYASLGTYQVHLKVWNDYGISDAYWPVTVGQPPTADMVVPPSIPAGQKMTGMAFGDASVARYEWAMGDGRYYEGSEINHIYTQSGDYYITMIAVNDFGGTEISRWIHVDPGMLSLYLPIIINGGQTGGQTTVGVADPNALTTEEILAGLDLPPVELTQAFVLQPIEMPPDSTPVEQLFLYINEARRQFNRQPLNNVAQLNAAAQSHAADMGANGFTSHNGSDGSTPEERFIWHQYTHGYAGETTAWGFEEARQAVEFWVNSPEHRRILLNEAATDVGVGFSADYNAPNVWYWSAEFGNQFAAASVPALRVQQPAQNTEALQTTPVTYGWNWAAPLSGNQKFVLYLHTSQGSFPIAEVAQPQLGSYYAVQLMADNLTTGSSRLQLLPGRYDWQVKLEDGGVLAESDRFAIEFQVDPNAPTPTATPTITETPLPPTPTLPPATPTLEWPTATPLPPTPTDLPPMVTTTPNP